MLSADSYKTATLTYRSRQGVPLQAYLPYLPYWVVDGHILVASVN